MIVASGNASLRLNHFYVVLDSATYRAIEENDIMRRNFAPNELRTTVRTDETYTGLYFYGRTTYFEVFDVEKSPRPHLGAWGLAFGVDDPGGISKFAAGAGPMLDPKPELITRLYSGSQVPWFYMATLPDFAMHSSNAIWIMEYHPEFLSRWNPRPGEGAGQITRQDILRRYAEVVAPVQQPMLADVVSITISVDTRVGVRLAEFARRVGASVTTASGSTEIHTPDCAIRLLTEKTPRGFLEVGMSAARESEPATISLGRASLQVGGGSIALTFGD